MITVGSLIEALSKLHKTKQLVICMHEQYGKEHCPMQPAYEIESNGSAVYLRTNELNTVALYGYCDHPPVTLNPIKAAKRKKHNEINPDLFAVNEQNTTR